MEWVKEDQLLVSGKIQQKRNNRTQTVEKGITKEDLWLVKLKIVMHYLKITLLYIYK